MTNQESNEAKASELNNRGYELAEAGRWQEAIAYYQKALRLNSRNVHSLTNMGNALQALGRLSEALTYQDKARWRFIPTMPSPGRTKRSSFPD